MTEMENARVLIVDDLEVNRDILSEHVRMMELVPETAENGEDALRKMRQAPPDLVLLDVLMPVMNGYETLTELRNDQKLAHIPVIIISAVDETESIVRCLELGADDYLTKPFKPLVLKARINASLAKKRLHDKEYKYLSENEKYTAMLKALFDSVTDGLVMLGPDLEVQAINRRAAELLETDSSDAAGRHISEIFSHDGTARSCPLLHVETGEILIKSREQLLLVSRSGREIHVMATTTRLESGGGAHSGYVVAFHDVSELLKLRRDLQAHFDFHGIVGRNSKMRDLLRMVERMAPTKATVLISGETGTGKELFASAIHSASSRAKGPLIKVSVAALPETLLESELFGHVKGAFTGADRDRPGRFEMADGGTIFLDEIGEIPAAVQVKLLRVLQDQVIERVGDTVSRKVDVRIIAATNRELRREIAAGRFREDLYYRLNTIHLHIPPLRERREDIISLADKFLKDMEKTENGTLKSLDTRCLPLLLEADWPGNIRQLQHAIEYAWYHSTSDIILPTDLPTDAFERLEDRNRLSGKDDGYNFPRPRRRGTGDERELLIEVLDRNNGSPGKAAEELGIHRTTLWRKLKRYGLLKNRSG